MIEFSLKKSEIKNKLFPVFKNISNSGILPSLGFLRFESNGFLKISSTDLETSVIYKSKDKFPEFSFCGDGFSIYSFVLKSLSEDINFNVSGGRIKIESGGFKASIIEGDESTFPKIPSTINDRKFIINSKNLLKELSAALKTVSKDDLRPSMTGVFFDYLDGKLNIISTDAHRLYFNVLASESNNGDLNFILPPKSAKAVINSFKETEPISISVNDNYVLFSGLETDVICRKIEAKCPTWRSVVPDNQYQFFLLRKDLKSFLSIASGFVNKSTRQLVISIKNNKIFFSGGDMDYDAEFEYTIPIHGDSNMIDCRFSVNLKFLLEGLNINKKDHAVSIKHSGSPTKAMIIDSCYLLMPLMVND